MPTCGNETGPKLFCRSYQTVPAEAWLDATVPAPVEGAGSGGGGGDCAVESAVEIASACLKPPAVKSIDSAAAAEVSVVSPPGTATPLPLSSPFIVCAVV